jgi:hypothetical protein
MPKEGRRWLRPWRSSISGDEQTDSAAGRRVVRFGGVVLTQPGSGSRAGRGPLASIARPSSFWYTCRFRILMPDINAFSIPDAGLRARPGSLPALRGAIGVYLP